MLDIKFFTHILWVNYMCISHDIFLLTPTFPMSNYLFVAAIKLFELDVVINFIEISI